MKKQTPHKQIKALDAEIARLQNSLSTLLLKEFEATCERINQLEIKRVQLLNPIENEQPLPTYKILQNEKKSKWHHKRGFIFIAYLFRRLYYRILRLLNN